MAKQLFCNDVVAGCQFKAEAATDAELLEKVKAHAAEKHGVKEITPELAAQVKAAIRGK
jgi:predicted small metal-binding protein